MGNFKHSKLVRKANTVRLEIKIFWKFRKLFFFMRKVINTGEKILESPKIVWSEDDNFSRIVIIFISKNIHRMRSIEILCKKGYARDTLGLLRVMFENLVDFKNMYQDKKIIQDYFDYDCYLKLKIARQFDVGNYSTEDYAKVQGIIKELERKWDKVRHKFSYLDKKKKKRIYTRWTGADNMQKLSDKVKLGRVYQQIWGYFSNYSHTSTISAESYILGIENEKIVLEIGSSQELIESSILTSCANFIDMMSIANEEYKLELEEDIERLSEALKLNVKLSKASK